MSSLISPTTKKMDEKNTAQATSIAQPNPLPSRLSKERDGGATPYNTPSNQPPISVLPKRPGNAARPINATVVRGRDLEPNAATPGNTLNSLEKISQRIVTNLQLGGTPAAQQQQNVIAPSYERKFSAALNDLDRHLGTQGSLTPQAGGHHYQASSPARSGQTGFLGSLNTRQAERVGRPSSSSNAATNVDSTGDRKIGEPNE